MYTRERLNERLEKKKHQSHDSDRLEHSSVACVAAARYEALREAALGQALPPTARSGLVLFLRRGMWAWVRALIPDVVTVRAAGLSPPDRPVAYRHDALVHILTLMAMSTNDRRSE